jgi:RNA recognition motif-containing protein
MHKIMDLAETKLEVGNLSNQTSIQDLKEIFGKFGVVEDVKMLDNNTAIVDFEDSNVVLDAISELNQSELHGRVITVKRYHTEINDSDMLNNDEIMNQWLKQYTTNVIELRYNKIPLSFAEFLDWFKTKQPNITFVFPIGNYKIAFDVKKQFIKLTVKKINNDILPQWIVVYKNNFRISANNNLIKTWKLHLGWNYNTTIETELNNFFDPELKYLYTRVNYIYELNLPKWQNILKQFFPDILPSKISFSKLYFPQKTPDNGTTINVNVQLDYKNLSTNNRMKLVDDPNYYEKELKIILNRENNFGYYNLNVLRVTLNDITVQFKTNIVHANLTILGETIKPDDYYITIGAYRLAWENICVKRIYSKEGLKELANNLNLDYNENNLCEFIGDSVNNLSWDNFIKD